ncbi:uncharacterized protein LOC119108225 [Pollicipes pollicipes]|uniref:uncharacterized protein LOC119108225 n=1 Tax=Pollicipes pollicipes TaxID=41117 RepID=UPI00188537EA|nr:uncharacterized protein LOC119108225 [Pollicipes pollicipes]
MLQYYPMGADGAACETDRLVPSLSPPLDIMMDTVPMYYPDRTCPQAGDDMTAYLSKPSWPPPMEPPEPGDLDSLPDTLLDETMSEQPRRESASQIDEFFSAAVRRRSSYLAILTALHAREDDDVFQKTDLENESPSAEDVLALLQYERTLSVPTLKGDQPTQGRGPGCGFANFAPPVLPPPPPLPPPPQQQQPPQPQPQPQHQHQRVCGGAHVRAA